MNFVGILIVLTECCHQFQMKLWMDWDPIKNLQERGKKL